MRGSETLGSMFQTFVRHVLDFSWHNAIFYADKMVSLSVEDPICVFLLAFSHFGDRDFVKTHGVLSRYNLTYSNENYANLAAKALIELRQFEAASKLLSAELKNPLEHPELTAQRLFLLGKANFSLENRAEAETNFAAALESDFTSVAAFEGLASAQSGKPAGLIETISRLEVSEPLAWVRGFYELCLCEKDSVDHEEPRQDDAVLRQLAEAKNSQLLTLEARRKFAAYQLTAAYEICFEVLQKDFFHFEAQLIYAEILVERKQAIELFSACTSFADNYPEHYLTFHLFGMYYYLLKNFETARKYFNKAIQVCKTSLKSWIMLGHCFAQQEESEQAMTVYRSCIRLFPNSYLPHLFMGMEYARVNNLKTALLSFQQAVEFTGPDPIIFNEIGCIYLKEKKLTDAKEAFTSALTQCSDNGISWLRHTVLNNLGNVHRKLREYPQAISCYEESLNISPNDPAVIFALAFACQLVGDLHRAILLYHKVVCMKHETHFVDIMLRHCLEDASDNTFGTQNQL